MKRLWILALCIASSLPGADGTVATLEYAQHLRATLRAQHRYCDHKEEWTELIREISRGPRLITVRVCHVERHGTILRYRYSLRAEPLVRLRFENAGDTHDTIVVGEQTRSTVMFANAEEQ